jgi:hypothetical protein
MCAKFVTENLKGKDQPDVSVEGSFIYKWFLKKYGCEEVCWIHVAQDQGTDSCEQTNEPSRHVP